MAYFDTSVLVPLFVPETMLTGCAGLADPARDREPRYVSDWTRTELVSAISGKVRVRVLSASGGSGDADDRR